MCASNGVFEIVCKLIQKKTNNNGFLWNPCPVPHPGGTASAWPNHVPPSTCAHPFQPPTLAHTPFTKSSDLSTLVSFWTINSLCTSLLLKPYDVLLRVKALPWLFLTRSDMRRYVWNDKNSSQRTPTQNLGLWKATVPPHFLQNLRYIQSKTDIQNMQTSLNLSLGQLGVLHVYGDHTEILADTGILLSH